MQPAILCLAGAALCVSALGQPPGPRPRRGKDELHRPAVVRAYVVDGKSPAQQLPTPVAWASYTLQGEATIFGGWLRAVACYHKLQIP